LNKEINNKVDEIINEIENSEVYQKYLSLQKQISSNKELMMLINQVKVLQKDILNKKKKKEDLDIVMNELNSNPLYREYNNTLYEINNTYGIIESSLNNYFDKIIN
jgi:cell fate (sporulation/competence/biofilm development) regulator YmcA (YheA/YmcA/DUF963 family)